MTAQVRSAAPHGRARPAEAHGLRTALYTCTFAEYDNLLSPLSRTPGETLLFSDRPAPLTPGWRHRPLPREATGLRPNEVNRYCKILAHRVLPDIDVSIYVDGNTLVLADLTPLLTEFIASEADIALFPYRTPGWTVRDDIDAALTRGRVAPERREAARQLRDRYEAEGSADLPVYENAVLLRRHDRRALRALMEAWWEETHRTAGRDQFTLPGLLQGSGVTTHVWDWHYADPSNGWVFRHPHRAGRSRRFGLLSDLQGASVVRARFTRLDRVLQRYAVNPIRSLLRRPPTEPDLLRPVARPDPKGD